MPKRSTKHPLLALTQYTYMTCMTCMACMTCMTGMTNMTYMTLIFMHDLYVMPDLQDLYYKDDMYHSITFKTA